VTTVCPSLKGEMHMAISLTDLQLSSLDSLTTPVDPDVDWVVTDGGSAIRFDAAGMNEDLADVPEGDRPAQTLEVLRAHQADAIAARSK
jgi:hypothetical protein